MEKKHLFPIVLLAALLLPCASLQAQRKAPQTDRPWSPVHLAFGDFRGRPTLSAEGSFADLRLGYTMQRDTIDGIVVSWPQAEAVMKPYLSWMLPGSRTPERLVYHQVQFDLVEAERRRLQADMLRGGDYDVLLDKAHQRLADQLVELQTSTRDGSDKAVLEHWEQGAEKLLDSLPMTKPLHYEADWVYEMGISLGYQHYTGGLDRCFTSGLTFNFNAGGLWQRHRIAFDLGIGKVYPRRDTVFTLDSWFYPGILVSDVHFLLEYGYRIVQNNHFSVTPFVAAGPQILDQTEDEDDQFYVMSGAWGGGLLLQHHLMFDVSRPVGGVADLYQLDLTARLMALHSSYSKITGHPSGWGIYLQIGVGLGMGSYIIK
jgi:hypothetical protein